MGAKPRKKPETSVLDQLSALMKMYLAGLDLAMATEWNPFAQKVIRGKREATEHWLSQLDALRKG